MVKRDIYNHKDVVEAMKGIDIAVYYLDPTKHSAKLTHATARDLNFIAADNFGRAASINKLKRLCIFRGAVMIMKLLNV